MYKKVKIFARLLTLNTDSYIYAVKCQLKETLNMLSFTVSHFLVFPYVAFCREVCFITVIENS